MDTAHDENMKSTSFWDKATEIYYSLLVARFVYFHSLFNWTQATDSNDSLLEHQIEVLDPADANEVHRKKRELFFFSRTLSPSG